MHILVSSFIVVFFLTFEALGQVPVDMKFYLNNINVSKAAKDYYNGKFKASDDNKTLSILDSLNSHNNTTRPFYIYLVSRMMNKADGALSEALGNATKEFIEHYPDQAISFLYSKKSIVDKKFSENWAMAMAREFMIECEGKEKICIKKSLQKTLVKVKLKNKTKLTQLYNQVQKYSH